MSDYKIDLFISYAHIDNQPLTEEKTGWISRFHASLHTLLSMRLGKSVRIWRDDKLQGNDRFAEEIINQFNDTAVLVSVLTPRYLQSEWCTREVKEFCKLADTAGGIFIDQKARVFKILKTPVDTQSGLPEVMQQMLGYEFFTYEDGVPMELDGVFGEKYGQDFNRKVNKLAYEISELLKTLETSNVPEHYVSADSSPQSKPVVYLAECSFDLRDKREILEAELRCLGYQVLPDQTLPREESVYVDAVTSLMEQSQLSIHLVGANAGAVPDGPSNKSISLLQNELAASRCQQSKLRRLIWLPAGTNSERLNHQAFLDAIHSDAETQRGADLITGDIEKLKSAIHATLAALENTEKQSIGSDPTTASVDEQKLMYLICTEQDRKATVPLRKYFRDRGVTVSMPVFKGDATEVRTFNHQLLLTCDVVIVFYGHGEEAWKRSIDTELKKLPAYLDGRTPPVTYTYLALPNSCDKDDMVDMEEPNLINGMEGACEQTLLARVLEVHEYEVLT